MYNKPTHTIFSFYRATCFSPFVPHHHEAECIMWRMVQSTVSVAWIRLTKTKISTIRHIIRSAFWRWAMNGPKTCAGVVMQYSEKTVHHVGLLYKYILRCMVNQTLKKKIPHDFQTKFAVFCDVILLHVYTSGMGPVNFNVQTFMQPQVPLTTNNSPSCYNNSTQWVFINVQA
jgi:hypothetical protein